MPDELERLWACLNCSTVMPAAELMAGGHKQGLYCPKCESENIMPADGQTRSIPEYFGEIGTRN